jgi:hypothetical protein
VSVLNSRDHRTREILAKLEAGQAVSQRSLSRELGIALGLTNLLLRQMARQGLVRLRRVTPNRVLYLITPAGVAEKARLSHKYFRDSISFYVDARRRIQASLSFLTPEVDGSRAALRVVFWGAGELAEIGYVCLQESNITLVGVVDDDRVGRRFFGHPVQSSSLLQGERLNGTPFDRLIVFALDDDAKVACDLSRSNVDVQRAFWISNK